MTRLRPFKLALFLFAALAAAAAAQTEDRRRIVVGATATPTPTATPAATPTATPTPAAVPTPQPTPPPAGAMTLFDLQAGIRQTLARPEVRRGTVGIKIAALDSGKVMFEENAEKYLIPASNMKSFTVAAALERLSPNFRFATSVLAGARPDAAGTIRGDLTIFGRGDVSFSTAFYGGDYFKGLDNLAERIAAAGVRRVEGGLVADETYFSGSPLPPGWEWDDLQWSSGAEVSAFPINDNLLGLGVRPGAAAGAPCVVALTPASAVMRVVNNCTTSARGAKSDLTVKKSLDQNVLEIGGSLPAGGDGFANSITVTRPAELFVALLKQRLERKGIVVTGAARVVGATEKALAAAAAVKTPAAAAASTSPAAASTSATPASTPAATPSTPAAPVELARLESPPFGLIAARTMKPSQNMYTETILWALGQEGARFPFAATVRPEDNPYSNPKSTSADRGLFVVRNFLGEIGVAPDGLVQYDGSGLSRHNLATPAALVQLYSYMARRSRYANAWLESLPIGGVDGTLDRRFRGVRTSGNVRAKTGTLDQVSALSGYVTTAAGEKIVFSIIVNGVPSVRARLGLIDEIVGQLANYTGAAN